MSAGGKKTRGVGLVESYRDSLERRVEQGDWSLVCRDEELCKQVEGCLREGSAQDTHSLLGLDPLSEMEVSLQNVPPAKGRAGLEGLAGAFEVLELAALNLYLCPWRKEYRVVKMFSGMFTHYVKPALTAQQANKLFGLLGYHAGGTNRGDELRLCSPSVPADTLLHLACAFFSARCECRLLLSALGSLARGVEWELSLVRERQRGHSLQVALESTERKFEPAPPVGGHDLTTAAELDLYTEEGLDSNGLVEPGYAAEAPLVLNKTASYVPSKATGRNPSPPARASDGTSAQGQTVCVSTLSYQVTRNSVRSTQRAGRPPEVSPELAKTPVCREDEQGAQAFGSGRKGGSLKGQRVCNCSQSLSLYDQQCLQCSERHSVSCPFMKGCQKNGHDLRFCEDDRILPPRKEREPPQCGSPRAGRASTPPPERGEPGLPKRHGCLDAGAAPDLTGHPCDRPVPCEDAQRYETQGHRAKPQLGSEQAAPKPLRRHACLGAGAPPVLICHTCSSTHDCLCPDGQRCEQQGHTVEYQLQPSKSMPFDTCCAGAGAQFACRFCKVFHSTACAKGAVCLRAHTVHHLKGTCAIKGDRCNVEPHILCRHCCNEYCKECWFRYPLNCLCGEPFDRSSPV